MIGAVLGLLAAVGPLRVACPADVAVVRDAATLSARLAEGPKDIWLSGTIHGDFAATRPVALHGCEAAVLHGSGQGTVLRLRGDHVLVENLTLQHSGARVSSEDGALKIQGASAVVQHVAVRDSLYGVAFEQCVDCVLSDSRIEGRAEIVENQRGDGIKLWEAHGSKVQRNVVQKVRDVVVWYSRRVTLEDNHITEGRYGTHFMYAHDALIRRSTMRDNTVGIFVMYSDRVHAEDSELSGARGAAGMGIGFKESEAVSLRRNAVVANTVGIYLDATPRDPGQPAIFEGNSFALNAVALRTHASELGAHFVGNDFLSNDVLIEVDGNGDARGVEFRENHWASYAGYDLDHDGVGDVPFQVKRASSELRDAHPNLRFFQGTFAMLLYDVVAVALPFFGTSVVLQDDRPAIHAHRELPR